MVGLMSPAHAEVGMNDPKKTDTTKFEQDPDEEKQEGLPWDHPDQDPDEKPDLEDLKKSAE